MKLKFASIFCPNQYLGKHESNCWNILIKRTFYLVANDDIWLYFLGVEKLLNRKVRSGPDCEDCWRRLIHFTSFAFFCILQFRSRIHSINLGQCQKIHLLDVPFRLHQCIHHGPPKTYIFRDFYGKQPGFL